MSDRSDQLASLIKAGNIGEADVLIRDANDYGEAERFVFTVLGEEKSTSELLEQALEVFFNSRENRRELHGYWVHSLSHFIDQLWKRRMTDWIKRFYQVSFRGANELGDSNCSSRLVSAFATNAVWSDDPADFHLAMDNLTWMHWKYLEYAKARVEHGIFESEVGYVAWQLRQPTLNKTINYDAQVDLVDVTGIQRRLDRLRELGTDVSGFAGHIAGLLNEQLVSLEVKLTTDLRDWERERTEKALEITRAQIAALTV